MSGTNANPESNGSNVTYERLDGNFGLRASNIDLNQLDDVALVRLLYELYHNRFLVLSLEALDKATFVRFARRLGRPIPMSRDEQFPEVGRITNQNVDTRKTLMGAAHWHTDQSFRSAVSNITLLYSVAAPVEGGETKFCNMAAAYAELPQSMKNEVEDLVVEHKHGVSPVARPGDHAPIPPKGFDQTVTVRHPLVRTHPESGIKTLYAITGTAQSIVGWPQDEGQDLLERLCEHTFRDRFIARYKYNDNELIFWDNPTTMHSATPIAAASGELDLRLLWRISLRGGPHILRNMRTN